MGFNCLMESSAVLEAFKEVLSAYDKKCTTVYALADQIMGMEKCEKALFSIPQDTFLRLQTTIQSKIMEELHNLSLIILDMEVQQTTMASVVDRTESNCRYLFERGSHNASEFQQLRTIYSISNYVTTLIDMKKFHLETMNYNDIRSICNARKDSSCKPVERELEKYIIINKK